MLPVTADQVRGHLSVLTRDIGVRLAGSRGEQQAADYVASAFERRGATVTVVQSRSQRQRRVQQRRTRTTWRGRRPCSCDFTRFLASAIRVLHSLASAPVQCAS